MFGLKIFIVIILVSLTFSRITSKTVCGWGFAWFAGYTYAKAQRNKSLGYLQFVLSAVLSITNAGFDVYDRCYTQSGTYVSGTDCAHSIIQNAVSVVYLTFVAAQGL